MCAYIVSQLKSTYNDESCCKSFKSFWLLSLSCNYMPLPYISYTRHLSWQLYRKLYRYIDCRTFSCGPFMCSLTQNNNNSIYNSIAKSSGIESAISASPLAPVSYMCALCIFLFSSWMKLQSHKDTRIEWAGREHAARTVDDFMYICKMFRWVLFSSSPTCKTYI